MMRLFACLTSTLALTLGIVLGCDSGGEGDDETGRVCGEEWGEKDGTTASIMDSWGAPCMTNAECETVLGAGAECVTNILGVYDLPGGYCSKPCQLPGTDVSYELDDMECDPNGGIACVGVQGVYTVCAMPCESDSQCGREGYACTIMPNIGADGDPTFCLMNSKDCCTTDSGECA